MAAYPDITGQEPRASSSINTGTDLYPSSNPSIPAKSSSSSSSSKKSSKPSYNSKKSFTNPVPTGSTENPLRPISSSVLSEEQLAQLPSIFRWKTHQDCLEMEGNIYAGHQHPSRGRMVMREPQGNGGISSVGSVQHNLMALFGFILSLVAAGAVIAVPFLALALVFYLPVRALSTPNISYRY